MGKLEFGTYDNFAAYEMQTSPVAADVYEQHQLMGYDIFCANHRFGPMPAEQCIKSMKVFAREVMPAFQ